VPALAALSAQGAKLFELACTADAGTLLARYRARAASGARHPGHVDLEALPELERELGAPPPRLLADDDRRLVWDTSAGIDTAAMIERMGVLLARA